jgi:hypothetical protein
MRVELEEPAMADELIVYLERWDCPVRRVGAGRIEVDERSLALGEALALVRAGRCYGCRDVVSQALAELGSPLCADCRDDVSRSDAGFRASRLKVEALLGVWNALHPRAQVSLPDFA